MPQKKSGGGIVGVIVIIFIVIFLLAMCSSGGSSSSTGNSSKTCQVCHRSFTDSANKNSISRTNMCKNCYSNFEWGMKATGKWD